MKWFIFDKYRSFESRVKDWRIWNRRELWSMIDKNAKFSIDLEIDLFESRHFEDQLIAAQRDNEKSFLMLNINKNEFKNNNMIDMI